MPEAAREGPKSAFDYENLAIQRIRERGLRLTMARLQVVRVLACADRPLSPSAIHERILGDGGRIDLVSVHRVLQALVDSALVHRIGLVDGFLACRVEDEHPGDIEHLVCASCGRAWELEAPSALVRETMRQSEAFGFSPETVRVEILGLCSKCLERR